ncbi:Uncharacterised protein [Bordetella pertussis]|nr:Uncharacterised protein [Bordetella pertussis]
MRGRMPTPPVATTMRQIASGGVISTSSSSRYGTVVSPAAGVRSAKMPTSARFSATAVTMSLLFCSSRWMRTAGWRCMKPARSSGRNWVIDEVLAAMRTWPRTPWAKSDSTPAMCSTSCSTRTACARQAWPASVSSTPAAVRYKSGVPSALSRSEMRLLAAPTARCDWRAPAEMLPWRATATNSANVTRSKRAGFMDGVS